MVRAAAGKSSTPSPAGSLQEVFEQCRRLGMRLSRQRRMVLDLLWSEKSHLSARDIFEQLNLRGRSIGHTSVYQNLEACLLYTSPSPRDGLLSRMPSSA